VKQLEEQREAILAQIDEPPISSSTPTSELLPMLLKMSAQKRNGSNGNRSGHRVRLKAPEKHR
jgi:hypothetical protein